MEEDGQGEGEGESCYGVLADALAYHDAVDYVVECHDHHAYEGGEGIFYQEASEWGAS